jgi:hypothetical protein
MPTVTSRYGTYTRPPPPLPPAPPVPTNPDGTPKEPEIVVVIAPRQQGDPYRSLLPYGGLSGPQENAVRDMQWATSHPWERVEAMGMRSQDFIDVGRDEEGYTTLELNETSGWRNPSDEELFQLIGGGYNRELTASTRVDGRGTNLDDYSRSLNGLQPRTRWDPETLSPQNLTSVGTSPARSSPYQRELIGDGIDGMQFARDLVNRAGFGRNWGNSANWRIQPNGGIATFKGSDNFQVTLRSATNSNSGLAAVEVKWQGTTVRWHIIDK